MGTTSRTCSARSTRFARARRGRTAPPSAQSSRPTATQASGPRTRWRRASSRSSPKRTSTTGSTRPPRSVTTGSRRRPRARSIPSAGRTAPRSSGAAGSAAATRTASRPPATRSPAPSRPTKPQDPPRWRIYLPYRERRADMRPPRGLPVGLNFAASGESKVWGASGRGRNGWGAPLLRCLVVHERDAALSADERVDVTGGELLRPVARVLAEALTTAVRDAELDRDAAVPHGDEVVRRAREAAGTQRRHRPRVDEQHPGHGPDVRHVPVTGEDEVDAALPEQRKHVA